MHCYVFLALTLLGLACAFQGVHTAPPSRALPHLSPAPPVCDNRTTSACTYTIAQGDHKYTFDLRSGCSATGYLGQDHVGHSYSFNICGRAPGVCLPGKWDPSSFYGPAIQSWGLEPQCNPPECIDPVNGSACCCTKPCEVLGQLGAPTVTLIDPSNPAKGGISIRYPGVLPSGSDPFWCDFDPSTGTQYKRAVSFFIYCDPAAASLVPLQVAQNNTNDCHYLIYMRWSKGCAATGLAAPVLPGGGQ